MHRPTRPFRTLASSLAVLCALGLMGVACSSDGESSSSSTTVKATSTTQAGSGDAATADGGAAEEEEEGQVDCTRTQNALDKVIAISGAAESGEKVTPEQFTKDLAAARKQVAVVQAQAVVAGASAPAIQLWTQYVNDTLAALEQAAESGDVAAAEQQVAALTTPQVTQAKTQVGAALTTACPGLTGWTN
ncbi:MAG: hypothetical protein ACOYOP_02840 [Microthrixaceae bacterium]